MSEMDLPVPQIRSGAAVHLKSRPAKPEGLAAAGLPTARPDDWQKQAIAKFRELLREYRSLQVYLDICVRCGACADKCHYFLGTGDPKNMPVGRAELMRKVYRRYFTLLGRLLGPLVGAEDLSERVIQEWYTYFYQCSECRRCSVFCPYGVDTAEITKAGREILASIGMAPKYITDVVSNVYRHGNNMGIPAPAWKDNCEFLEDELKDETGKNIPLPVDEEGAEVLFLPPSADIFVNTDTMMGYAKFFYAAGVRWTTSTYCDEAANFGLFLNYRNLKQINARVVEAARRLRVKKIIFGECGHAWRAALMMNTLNGPLDFLDSPYPIHITEFTSGLIRRGAFKFDKSANAKWAVTYHDPCNVARAGGLLEEPREILRAVVLDVREMPSNTTRQRTFCCGGGGGLLTEELMELRMAGGKARAEAVKTTGANYVATICAICKAQLRESMKHHDTGAEVGGVHDLVAKALVL